jgi:hypothetical protein
LPLDPLTEPVGHRQLYWRSLQHHLAGTCRGNALEGVKLTVAAAFFRRPPLTCADHLETGVPSRRLEPFRSPSSCQRRDAGSALLTIGQDSETLPGRIPAVHGRTTRQPIQGSVPPAPGTPPMGESSTQVVDRRPADLSSLQRELEAIASQAKLQNSDAKPPEASELVLVIRGK